MDEPLSNLDAKLRLEMRTELKRLHTETNSTFVYVTHDQLEAMTLATEVCLMEKGLLQQYAPPLETYAKPNNLFVADFVGNPTMNFVPAEVIEKLNNHKLKISFLGFEAEFETEESIEKIERNAILGIRPEYITNSKNGVEAIVYSSLPGGMETTIKLDVNGTILTSVEFGIIDYPVDTKIKIKFTSENIVLFNGLTKERVANGSLNIK
jgi:multiple sugar transport system ATP-binding protein